MGKGLTSDDPIVINCPKCNAHAAVGVAAGYLNKLDAAYCYDCKYWFPYTYIKDHWYYSKAVINTYSTKYIGAPNYWEYNTQIKNPTLNNKSIVVGVGIIKNITISKDYPHTCPNCGKPAYVGLFKVDCSANCKGLQ